MLIADKNSLLQSLLKTLTFLIVRQNFTNEMSGKILQLSGKYLQSSGKMLQLSGKYLQLSGEMLQLSGKNLQLSGKMLRFINFSNCQAKTYRSFKGRLKITKYFTSNLEHI